MEVTLDINGTSVSLKDIDEARFEAVRVLCRELVMEAPGNIVRLYADGAEKFISVERDL